MVSFFRYVPIPVHAVPGTNADTRIQAGYRGADRAGEIKTERSECRGRTSGETDQTSTGGQHSAAQV